MTIRKTVLWICIFVLLILPLAARQFRRENPLPEPPNVIHVDEFIAIHQGRIKEQVDLLRKQSLEETFVHLLESQQYSYPGFHSPLLGAPREMEELLSTRSFLKVLQQFGKLPREQALVKLPLFCEMAIEKFETSLEQGLAPTGTRISADTYISMPSSKHMVCTSMLLAARVGENGLLLKQLEAMESLITEYVSRDGVSNPDRARSFASFEDDCLFTVLMYALKQGNADLKIDIPDTIKQKTIPLYRWDADATHYDLLPNRGMQATNPKDIVEQITVYAFPIGFDSQQKKRMINTLKERLSK